MAGLFNIFKQKPKEIYSNQIDEEELEALNTKKAQSLATRMLNNDIKEMENRLKRLEQIRKKQALEEQLNYIESEIYGGDDDDTEEQETPQDLESGLRSLLLAPLLQKFGMQNQNNSFPGSTPLNNSNIMEYPQSTTQTTFTEPGLNLTDTEIKEALLKNVSRPLLKTAKNLEDETLKSIIQAKSPAILGKSLTPDTLNRTILLIRAWK